MQFRNLFLLYFLSHTRVFFFNYFAYLKSEAQRCVLEVMFTLDTILSTGKLEVLVEVLLFQGPRGKSVLESCGACYGGRVLLDLS